MKEQNLENQNLIIKWPASVLVVQGSSRGPHKLSFEINISHDLPPKILYRYYFVFLSFFHGWWESPEEMNVTFIEWRKALGGKGLRD